MKTLTHNKKPNEITKILRYAVVCALLWTVMLAGLFTFYFNRNRHAIHEIGVGMAQDIFEKDILLRRWADQHGGVYVMESAATATNHQFSHINPALMSRQIYELARERPGIPQGHITSLNPIRPENNPDPWETQALRSFEKGSREVVELVHMNGQPYMRIMRPLVTEKPCLKCHSAQGYKEGDGRGGISVTLSLSLITKTLNSQLYQVAFIHSLIWLLGMGFIMIGSRKIVNTVLLLRNERNALFESEETYRRQFADNTSIMLLIDPSNKLVIDANITALHFYGYHRDQMLTKHFSDILALPSSEDDVRPADSVFPNQGSKHETQHRLEDGSIREVEESSSIIQFGERHILHVIVFDISERKRAEKALVETQNQLTDIINFLPDATLAIDKDKRIIIWNRAIEQMTGIQAADMIGKNDYAYTIPFYGEARPQLMDLVFADQEEIAAKYPNLIREGDTIVGEAYCNALYNGRGAWVFAKASPLHDQSGNVIGAIECIRDITAQKRAEEERRQFELQFQQTQKLESLGVLSGGIAHDFNNILAIIMGYCALIRADYNDAEAYIPVVEKAAERAAELCRQMLTYAGKAQYAPTQVNMWLLVDEMVNMLRATVNQNASINFLTLSSDILIIEADASQLRQVVMNLIINAAESIGDLQGEVNVSLTNKSIMEGQSDKDHLGILIPVGQYLCLNITDNGCGMTDETKQRISEPFYTTKFSGRGLGMSAVLGIITAHSGALQLSSKPNNGSTFTVYLPVPLYASAGAPLQQQLTPLVPWQESGTILLVEDEEQVRTTVQLLLKKLGFNIVTASNGKEALEMYQKNEAKITVVITDIGMPVMDGYELFGALKKICPGLPIIISSGFGEVAVTSRIAREKIAGFINKPYKIGDIQNTLKNVMVERQLKQSNL